MHHIQANFVNRISPLIQLIKNYKNNTAKAQRNIGFNFKSFGSYQNEIQINNSSKPL